MSGGNVDNILFILADQLRADFTGPYGARFLDTPNIDRLAQSGTVFDSAYSASPLCVPARASLLSGMSAAQTGVADNNHWLREDLEECGVRTWPRLLSDNGYETCAVGKMHFHPWERLHGFARRVIAEDKRWPLIQDDYAKYLAGHGLRKYFATEVDGYAAAKGAITSPIPWEHSIDHYVGTAACQFLSDHDSSRPFALMVGFPGPHCPYDPAPEFLARIDVNSIPDPIRSVSEDMPATKAANVAGNRQAWNGVDYSDVSLSQIRTLRAHYGGLVLQIDHEIGRILDRLQELGLRERTLVVVASDHGDYLDDHGMVGKGSYYESAARVPLIVSPPGSGSGRRRPDLVELTDVTATILQHAGIEIPRYYHSRPLPLGPDSQVAARESVVGVLSSGWMLRSGRYKLMRHRSGECALFNIQADPSEQHNLAAQAEYAGLVREMDASLWSASMNGFGASHADKKLPGRNHYADREYGQRGWSRSYPQPPLEDL